MRPRQDGRHFPDDIFKCIFLNKSVSISITISLKFAPKGPINNIPALVQIMAWRRPGAKPLSEPMMVCVPTHICVTRSQWVKQICFPWYRIRFFYGQAFFTMVEWISRNLLLSLNLAVHLESNSKLINVCRVNVEQEILQSLNRLCKQPNYKWPGSLSVS